MKKALSILLAAVLILSFAAIAGCSKTEPPAATQAPAATAAPAPAATAAPAAPAATEDPLAWVTEMFGEVPDPAYTAAQYQKLQDGKIKVGFCLLDLSQNFLVNMTEGFKKYWEDLGATYAGTFSGGNDSTVLIQQIENCGEMGLDLICVGAQSVSSLANVCVQVMEKGTKVIIRGEESIENCGFEPSGLETSDNNKNGWYLTDMAITYMEQKNPGIKNIKIATGELSLASQLVAVFNSVRARIAQTPNASNVYVKDMCFTLDDGYNLAAEALIYDPEVRVFLTFDEAPAIGFSNYIISRTDLNVGEFFTGATSSSQQSADLYELSKENKSCLRGYVGADWKDVSTTIDICSYKCLLGLVEEPWIELSVISPQNAFGYSIEKPTIEFPGKEAITAFVKSQKA